MLTIHLSIVIFLPLAAALLAALLPGRAGRWLVLAGTAGSLGYAIAMIVDLDASSAGLQYVTDIAWISELGIRYSLGVDGLSVFMIALTTLLWFFATLAACLREWERPRLFFFQLALAETAVLGVFCAQDLALFALFFDLTLVPFYFLIGAWGERDRVRATTKLVIYTLIGSLLALAGAVALGVLAAQESGGELSFALADLTERTLPEGTQQWIFVLFAFAFLVKMPAFPLHGWMPDAYRAAPIPVLVLLSAVLSKMGAYGFLRIVLPILPDASLHFQELVLVIAVVSILYGSALAFSQDEARLVVGYSSVAQLGFITLGIFSLDDLGAQGAVLQMVTHALVAGALFFVIGALARRTGGSESLAQMGGVAMRAPVLAALFLIVGFATLAMPGTANFIGELLILFGVFESKLVFGIVASAGVALAAVYMIRFYQRAMHNRVGERVTSRDLGVRELAVIAPLVLVIVALSVYPQLVLERTEAATVAKVEAAQALAGAEPATAPTAAAEEGVAVTPLAQIEAPVIDYLQLAPILATLGGSVVVLMVGLLRGRFVQRALMPALTLASLLVATAFCVAIWEPGEVEPIVEGALSMDTLALGLSVLFYAAGIFTVLLSLRARAVREAGAGEYHSLLLASITGMTVLAAADNLVTVFVGFELLSIPLYVLCGSRVRREPSLESGLKYLVIGSVGSATLLYGLALIYGATGATDFPAIAAALDGSLGATDPLFLTGVALSATGLAFKASVAPFHQWTPDVYQGAPTPITTFMAVATKAAAFAIFLRLFVDALGPAQPDWAPALAALAWATIVIGNVGAIAQSSLKRMLAWSSIGQAGYMLVGVVVGTQLGLQATAFYLAVYLLMNVAAFAVVIARERRSEHGDGIRSLEGLGAASPWLAWPMTIAMLALAGIPLTAGFFGKFYLIEAAVEGGWESLGVAIVIGSMVSLVYYLRVLAVMWMSPLEIELPAPVGRVARRVKPVGGWSPEADARAQPEVSAVALLAAAATIVLGIVPGVLFDVAADIGPVFGALY